MQVGGVPVDLQLAGNPGRRRIAQVHDVERISLAEGHDVRSRPDEPSDCREVRPDSSDAGVVVLVCGEGETDTVPGYYCEPGYNDVREIEEGWGIDVGDVGDDETVSLCWPDYEQQDPQILRSLVIGDTLWTLSWRSLQANALTDLAVTGTVVWG